MSFGIGTPALSFSSYNDGKHCLTPNRSSSRYESHTFNVARGLATESVLFVRSLNLDRETAEEGSDRNMGFSDKTMRDRDPQKDSKTYNRRDSQMVTHSSTSRPVQCLCMAERTGCPVFTDLWSYVLDGTRVNHISLGQNDCIGPAGTPFIASPELSTR